MSVTPEQVAGHMENLRSAEKQRAGARAAPCCGFRHFFRHASAVELDTEQLDELRRKATARRSSLAADFARLDAFLTQLAGT